MQKPCANNNCDHDVTIDSLGTALFVSIDGVKHHVCSHSCAQAVEEQQLPYGDEYHFPMGSENGVECDGSLVSVPKAHYLQQ